MSKKNDKNGIKKVKINPEDILIEYIERLVKLVKELNENYLTQG